MKILAFVDSHANQRIMKELGKRAKDADIVVCAGDISVFGMDLLEALEAMNSWNKPVYLIHGNHEDESILEDVNDHFENIHFIHAREIEIGDFSVLGWGGGGFAKEDPDLANFAKDLKPKKNRIMLFHGPPYGTTIDWLDDWEDYRGCKTRRQVIERLQPALVIAGHLHPNAGKHDKIGKSAVLNPGPLGALISLEKGEEIKPKRQPPKKSK